MKWLLLILLLSTSCSKSPLFESVGENQPQRSELNASEYNLWSDERYEFGLQWIKPPKVGQNSPFKIKFWDRYTTNALGPYTVLAPKLCVFLWMSMPDGSEHGSSPVTLTKETDHYSVNEVYFIMPGKWKIFITTTEDFCPNSPKDDYLEGKSIELSL